MSARPNFRFGTESRGIEISRDSPGRDKKGYESTRRYRTGLNYHEIQREKLDGSEISPDCTIPRDGIPRDENCTALHGTALRYYGFLRDGILPEKKKHSTPRDSIDISRDCRGRDVKPILHGICTVHSTRGVSYDIIRLYHTRTKPHAMAWTTCIRSLNGERIKQQFMRTMFFTWRLLHRLFILYYVKRNNIKLWKTRIENIWKKI